MTPAELAKFEDELLLRYGARDSFANWIKYRDSGLVPALHHQLIIKELEKVESGKTRRLMLIFPPGAAKSTYASVEFPPWYMGRNPKHVIIGCSNIDELAQRFGRKVRNIVAGRKFKNVFDFTLSSDSTAAGDWENSLGGEYKAAGVGSAIAGRRGDLGLVDDPVKSKEAADSEREQNKTWDWYITDFEPRLKPDSRQIVIQTRWNERDLAGRILERDGDMWRVVRVPMECDSLNDPLGRAMGERLWPEWFTEEMVTQAKKDFRLWNSLYQGNPIPEEGDYFKAEWFGEYTEDSLPQNLEHYGGSDYAVTEGKGDYTEHGIIGVDANSNIYVRDWWFGQTKTEEWIEAEIDLIQRHQPSIWFGEKGVIKRAIEPALVRRMDERRAYCRLEWLPSIADKTARARSIQQRASMGKIFFPKNARWKTHVLSQLLAFPAGKNDDAVDVFSLFGRGLELVADGGQRRQRRHHLQLVANGWMS